MPVVEIRKQRVTPLIEAVAKQDVYKVKAQITAGVNLEETDSFGQTALHWAAKKGSVEIARLLLNAGSDPHACDEDGQTPILNARQNPEKGTEALFGR
jgi:ankyrin repeat protein